VHSGALYPRVTRTTTKKWAIYCGVGVTKRNSLALYDKAVT
jgi:hypothetical protein